MTPPDPPPFTPNSGPPAAPGSIHPVIVADEVVPERRGVVAFLSNVPRSGAWTLPRNFRAVTFLGTVELDLTGAHVGAGVSLIEVKAIMGTVTILVPPELRVECDGDPIAATFEIKYEVASTTSPSAPLVRISGTAILGTVEVKVVDPNAPKWYEKLKARWEARKGRGRA